MARETTRYEHRVIVLYDFLGWRSEVADAGDDSEKIGRLRQTLLLHAKLSKIEGPVVVSTFSDNVAISTIPDKAATPVFLDAIATIQLHATARGFLMRGGIAVGDLIHDDDMVFGPALNRALELESKIAKYPRIIVDDDVAKIGDARNIISEEGGLKFLDPFTTAYFGNWINQSKQIGEANASLKAMGLDLIGSPGVHGTTALNSVIDTMQARLRTPLADKEYEKVVWLYDRIAGRLGVPASSSYPRVRPAPPATRQSRRLIVTGRAAST
jgi:hypothetical protein